jgi:hypothetical protein
MSLLRSCLLLTLTYGWAATPTQERVEPTPEERLAAASRMRLQACDVSVQHRTYREFDRRLDHKRTTRVILGDRDRRVIMMRADFENGSPWVREVQAYNCVFGRSEFDYTAYGNRPASEPPLAASIHEAGTLGVSGGIKLWFDPRKIGLCCTEIPNLARSRFDEVIGRSRDRQDVTDFEENGRAGRRVRIWSGDRYRAEIDIIPSQEHAVTRILVADDTIGLLDSVESKVAYVEAARTWFPTSCVYTRHFNGVHHVTEEATIELRSVNAPIDESLFKPSGWGVEPGTYVTGVPGNDPGPHIWNGEEFVPESKASAVQVRGMEREPRPIGYYVAAAAFVAAAGLFAWKALRVKGG